MKTNRALLIFALAGAVAAPALADWNVGDDYKMHYPQLPDPNGIDVRFSSASNTDIARPLADDFVCTETGPISDIHFWYSIRGDFTGRDDNGAPKDPTQAIAQIGVGIFADIPADPSGGGYSRPGQLLWTRNFSQNAFHARAYGSGDQSWYDPYQFGNGGFFPHDHTGIYQANMTDISEPFIQTAGTTYWLGLYVITSDPNVQIGWKTSGSPQFQDTAVFQGDGWLPMYDPRVVVAAVKMDLAFVITPSPSAAGVLALGGLISMRRRRTA